MIPDDNADTLPPPPADQTDEYPAVTADLLARMMLEDDVEG